MLLLHLICLRDISRAYLWAYSNQRSWASQSHPCLKCSLFMFEYSSMSFCVRAYSYGRRHTSVFWSVRGSAAVRRIQRRIHSPAEILFSPFGDDPFKSTDWAFLENGNAVKMPLGNQSFSHSLSKFDYLFSKEYFGKDNKHLLLYQLERVFDDLVEKASKRKSLCIMCCWLPIIQMQYVVQLPHVVAAAAALYVGQLLIVCWIHFEHILLISLSLSLSVCRSDGRAR